MSKLKYLNELTETELSSIYLIRNEGKPCLPCLIDIDESIAIITLLRKNSSNTLKPVKYLHKLSKNSTHKDVTKVLSNLKLDNVQQYVVASSPYSDGTMALMNVLALAQNTITEMDASCFNLTLKQEIDSKTIASLSK
jgi:hypothetical protein